MVKVGRNNTIELTRGDSLRLKVVLTVGGAPYLPEEGDAIRFALKRDVMDRMRTRFVDEEPLIVKSVSTDSMYLELEPVDTAALDFGEYVYDVQITRANGFVRTFVADARFIIGREVD